MSSHASDDAVTLRSSANDSFAALAPYWHLFEVGGLNAQIMNFAAWLRSEVLVLGSGQGLVPSTLQDHGFAVTSVDVSSDMADYARARRAIHTLVADAATVTLGQRFRTIIVNTGILNEDVAESPFIQRLVGNIMAHLDPDGCVVIAFFAASRVTEMERLLDINGPNPVSDLFWNNRVSLEQIKHGYLARGYDARLVEHLFRKYAKYIDVHRQHITTLGEAYVARHAAEPPVSFLNLLAGFRSHYLSQASEQRILDQFKNEFDLIERAKIADDTHVVIFRPAVKPR